MAGIQASGVGSGLDVNSLVSQLVNAEGAPLQQRITRHEVAVTTKVSALGALKGALAAFKAALEPLKSIAAFQTHKATSADTDFFTATADSTAAAGHYEIEVVRLAQAHQLGSDPFLGGAAASVGYGDLEISVGSSSFTVTIDEDADTLADIRDAINDAPDNTGVQATLLNGVGGSRLVLTATQTGAANEITVTTSGGDGGLDALEYDPPTTEELTQMHEAQNAAIRFGTFEVQSDTNVFEDAIDGVTITVLAGTEGETVALDVAYDKNSVQSRIQKFVTEYNAMQSQFAKLGSYNAETKVAGALLGDSLLRAVESDTRHVMNSPIAGVSGDYTSLSSIGITTSTSGALQINSAKLTTALASDPEAIAELFGSENGIAARLFSQMQDRLATDGDIEVRNARLGRELKNISADKQALSLRMAQIEARYRKQFTALDSLLSQMQSTSNYLTQQLASLPKSGG
jgi:flagellar hook-associated protein 2